MKLYISNKSFINSIDENFLVEKSLLLALMAIDIQPGDEVITTPFTWISTGEMITLLRATPVFVDIEPDTYNIDAKLIEAAITKKTKAIMPVSL